MLLLLALAVVLIGVGTEVSGNAGRLVRLAGVVLAAVVFLLVLLRLLGAVHSL